MPFFRSLDHTAPNADHDLPWPIDGLAYVIAFMGPLSAGPLAGMVARDWRAFVVGSFMGIGITFLNAWLSDMFFDPWIARSRSSLQRRTPRILCNVAAFAWAIALSAVAMFAPIAVFAGF